MAVFQLKRYQVETELTQLTLHRVQNSFDKRIKVFIFRLSILSVRHVFCLQKCKAMTSEPHSQLFPFNASL